MILFVCNKFKMYSRIPSRFLYNSFALTKRQNSIQICVTRKPNYIYFKKHPFSSTELCRSHEEIHQHNYEKAVALLQLEENCTTSDSDQLDEEIDEFEFDFSDNNDDEINMLDLENITGNDPRKIELVRSILEDKQRLREEGFPFIPKRIPKRKWEVLMECSSFFERKQFLKYVYLLERKKMYAKKKAKERKKMYLEREILPRQKRTTSSLPIYQLSYNSIFNRICSTRIHEAYDYKLALAEMFGPHLIIDCGYESVMNMKEKHHCCTQLFYSWTRNRMQKRPFDLIFCNMEKNSAVFQYFSQLNSKASKLETPFHITDKHYLDLYPAEKLIYLSPHSENEMEEYESDCIYIIGAFVDEVIHDPLSLEKAKRDGIRTAKFPIDKHMNWCQGSQFLPMNQCVSIMSKLKDGRPWAEALRSVAKRKLNYVGLHFKKTPKTDLKSTKHMWAIYSYEMGNESKSKQASETNIDCIT